MKVTLNQRLQDRAWLLSQDGCAVACLVCLAFCTPGHLEAQTRVLAPAPRQPTGALSGRIVFTSAGHGWTYDNDRDGWYTQRGDNNEIVEDYGNLDQMTLFAFYCFNAGATVVPLRPVGHQTNEVVLDNDSSAVQFAGSWANSVAASNYFGTAGNVPYRFANLAATETATATFTPTIPVAGFYPVYTWVSAGGNRTSQLYRIRHTGGEGVVRVPHHMVGNGWVYLGTYYFQAGSNALNGAVVISNLQPNPSVGSVAIADAIRFGNGMGDVVPISTGGGTPTVSGYPREEEAARYWVQRALGVGVPTDIYERSSDDASDNVGTPPRMARHMNREEAGRPLQRVFLSFHSNASGSSNPTARGCLGLYNDETVFPGTATPNQYRLAQLVAREVNNDLTVAPGLEVPWFSRSDANLTFARSDFAFGEINNASIGDEFDATILEAAFHDNPDDARLLRDPEVRAVMARAAYQALVRYMNEFDGLALSFLPEPPGEVCAVANGSGDIVISWTPPATGGGTATGYVVYRSTDGYGFGQPLAVAGSANSVTLTGFVTDMDWHFRVSATNAGGESMPSDTVGCRLSAAQQPPVLVVNGFDRFDRTLAVRQTAGPGIGSVSGGVQTFDRIKPRLMNSFDYVVQYGQALGRNGVAFDSCPNEAVMQGRVRLTDYAVVIWACGLESTADETFSSAEQGLVSAFLNAGGRLFVSGAEIAWDLDRDSGPSAADRAFLNSQLHADLAGDANDDANTYSFTPAVDGIFAGNPAGQFDNGGAGIYHVPYPDALTPVGAGAKAALRYSGGNGGVAALQHEDPITGSKVVFFGFPFEAMTSAVLRERYLFDILRFFDALPAPALAAPQVQLENGLVTLTWTAVPGKQYQVQYRDSLTAGGWLNLGGVVNATNTVAMKTDPVSPTVRQRFYQVLLVD